MIELNASYNRFAEIGHSRHIRIEDDNITVKEYEWDESPNLERWERSKSIEIYSSQELYNFSGVENELEDDTIDIKDIRLIDTEGGTHAYNDEEDQSYINYMKVWCNDFLDDFKYPANQLVIEDDSILLKDYEMAIELIKLDQFRPSD